MEMDTRLQEVQCFPKQHDDLLSVEKGRMILLFFKSKTCCIIDLQRRKITEKTGTFLSEMIKDAHYKSNIRNLQTCCDGPKTLLTSSIPYLQFNSLSIEFNSSYFEVNSVEKI